MTMASWVPVLPVLGGFRQADGAGFQLVGEPHRCCGVGCYGHLLGVGTGTVRTLSTISLLDFCMV